jgi:hypothetical protein
MQVIGSAYQAVRMVCTNSLTMSEDVCAYVLGIKVASNRIEGEFEPGDIIEYPISYLPWVELPAEVRFVSERTGQEIAEPFHIRTHDEAIALVGIGEAVIQTVAIDQGMIRGVVVNRVNGLLRPQMFARINGLVPRTIAVEQPRLLDDGGASFQFSAQLLPADLGENGLTAEIFLLGQDRPLTSIAFRRADVDDLTKRIVEFDARLAQLSQSTEFRFKTSGQEMQVAINVMQQRIDAFIEYAASFMFDRIAASSIPTVPGEVPLSPELNAKVVSFLGAVNGSAQSTNEMQASVNVPLASHGFSFGWSEVEDEGGLALRRMQDNAVVFNPYPDRLVAEIRMMLWTLEGAAQPSLRAAFDAMPAAFNIERGKRKGDRWLARITPTEGEPPMQCTALSLLNMMPASGSRTDGKVAVADLTFIYAA